MGGEHGRWWAVPVIDYVEGMMSGGTDNYAWDAPYLRPPMNKDGNKWEQYETLGMNPQYRVPLWELVFHDCVVSTWYWGDANDFLTLADPKFTDMKNCYNICMALYLCYGQTKKPVVQGHLNLALGWPIVNFSRDLS